MGPEAAETLFTLLLGLDVIEERGSFILFLFFPKKRAETTDS